MLPYCTERTTEAIHDPFVELTPVARYSTGQDEYSNLFVVIIGINKYLNCTPLRGAVADANAMKEYLLDSLGVPEDHILTLLDDQATRAAIIQAFRNLQDDPRIGRGCPILIFFAGHGAELRAPSAWHIEGKIQSLLPYDCKKSIGPTGVYPIPDRTIGALIDNIAKDKGNNIIVFLDCCFSGGGTREEGHIPRTDFPDPNILVEVDDLDQDILEARHGGLPEVFSGQGLRSHVLLAACGEAESAYEREGRGLFTLAVLKILKESVISDVTYVEVIERVTLSCQSPRCIGVNKERAIFDVRVPGRRKVGYPVRYDNTDSLVVDVGHAHGVSHGIEFTLYNQQGARLGTVKVGRGAEIRDFQTKFTISEADHDWRNVWSVTLARVGEVSFHLGQGRNSLMATKTLQQMLGGGTNEPNFQFVEDPEGAELGVMVENGQVVFEILDQRTRGFGLTELPYTATLDNVDHILGAAEHYYWYLHLTNGDSTTDHKIDVDFYMLKKELDEEKQVYRIPDGPGLCRKGSGGRSDVIDFVVTPKTHYGIEIKNDTTSDLYLNAFLFNSDLSIVPYRIQSNTGNPEAPLKQKGSLTIGYGSSGERPFTYWLAKNQNVDVGYLKLLFATRPVDLSHVQQESPFVSGKNTGGPKARLGGLIDEVDDDEDFWFTKMIPIVRRRWPGR